MSTVSRHILIWVLLSFVLALQSMGVAAQTPPPPAQNPSETFSIPEETVLTYYNLLYSPISIEQYRDQIDQRFCQAYSLLARISKAQISRELYVAAAWYHRTIVGRDSMNVGSAVYNDSKTIAKVIVTLRLSSWVLGPQGQQTRAITLVSEDGTWRIVLADDQISALRDWARRGTQRSPSCSP